MESVDKKINSLLNSDFGKKAELTLEDKVFIENYQEGIFKLEKEDKHLFFANVIRREGRYGFASGGPTNTY